MKNGTLVVGVVGFMFALSTPMALGVYIACRASGLDFDHALGFTSALAPAYAGACIGLILLIDRCSR